MNPSERGNSPQRCPQHCLDGWCCSIVATGSYLYWLTPVMSQLPSESYLSFVSRPAQGRAPAAVLMS